MMLQSTVRLYEVLPSGELEALLITDPAHYGGTCPNVGDVIVRDHLGTDVYFSVQRRLFISDPFLRSGWIVLLQRMEPTPLVKRARKEWDDETQFWISVAEEEAAETEKRLEALLAKPPKTKKSDGSAIKNAQAAAGRKKNAIRKSSGNQAEELDLTNRDPDYWTPARKKQLRKLREKRD